MNPDTLESRLARLEQRVEDDAALRRELADLVRTIPQDVAIIKERVAVSVRRSNDCLDKHQQLEDYLHQRERDQAHERKIDRRWLIGTFLSSAALVIAAIGLLADKF